MAGDGREEEKEKRKVGGLKTMPFVLGWSLSNAIIFRFVTDANEFCDRFATTGFNANMITYLTDELHMPLVQASNTITNFAGMAGLTPIIGGLIADSFAGRFWTITIGSLIYQLGMISLTLSAVLPMLRPQACKPYQTCEEAYGWHLWVLYISLFLTSLGSGGIRPCVVAFGADQFDMAHSKKPNPSGTFFNWYYFCLGLATLMALTVIVYIQDNVGWGWGLGLPTIAMGISVVAFVVGYPLYRNFNPAGSPFTRLAQVFVAAIRKRNEIRPLDPGVLYQNKHLDAAISYTGRLVHTDELKFFDRAALVTQDDNVDPGPPNLWKISTIHRVEELKSIIRMIPIWAAGILLITASSHQNSFTIQQAKTMDRHLTGSFQIPAATMSVFNALALLVGVVAYDRLIVPIARRFTGIPSGITYLHRMGVGFAIAILSTAVAGIVEVKRKNVAARHGLIDDPHAVIPISVFWLVPQYSLHGLAETFVVVGHLEFLYDQAPESMRSTAAALFWMSISAGNYLSTLLVALIHRYTGSSSKENWLPDKNINKGKLDYYYWVVTGLQVVNLVYYTVCAWFYTYKPLATVDPDGDGPPQGLDDVENGNGCVELPRTDTSCKDVVGSHVDGRRGGGKW